MKEYHKIQTLFKRDPDNNFKTLLTGEFAIPKFKYLQNNNWVFTEKVDGTNIRIMFDGESVRFGGRTDNAQIPSKLVTRLNELFSPQKFKDLLDCPICLYGEGYGAKIQEGGGNYRPDQDFVLFDIRIGDWWLQRKDVEQLADQLCIGVVPIVGEGNLLHLVSMVGNGFDSVWGDFKAEGIVARPAIELFTRNGKRIITKLKTKDFKNP